MNKHILTLLLLVFFNSYSQEAIDPRIKKIDDQINELQQKSKDGLSPSQRSSVLQSISNLEQEKTNLKISINQINKQKQQQDTDILNAQNSRSDNKYEIQNYQRTQASLQQLRTQQEDSRKNAFNSINNNLSGLASSMQNMAMNQAMTNLKARQTLIDNFARENQQKIEKIISIYNSIPKENFNRNLTGIYKAFFISNKKYIYAPDNELSCVEDCYIEVNNSIITKIFMFGNKEIENTLPIDYPENSILKYGLVKYINLDNLETYNIILIEPYLKNKTTSLSLKENNVGYITLWSSDKDDVGKTVYIQELYRNGSELKLNREVAVKIQYSKNEKEIKANRNIIKTAFNLNYTIFCLGELTNTPFGRIPLAPKISDPKNNNKILEANENRFIEVKKYRE